jgi:hypothetical protein
VSDKHNIQDVKEEYVQVLIKIMCEIASTYLHVGNGLTIRQVFIWKLAFWRLIKDKKERDIRGYTNRYNTETVSILLHLLLDDIAINNNLFLEAQ